LVLLVRASFIDVHDKQKKIMRSILLLMVFSFVIISLLPGHTNAAGKSFEVVPGRGPGPVNQESPPTTYEIILEHPADIPPPGSEPPMTVAPAVPEAETSFDSAARWPSIIGCVLAVTLTITLTI
jgi:hypothetical protein